MSNLPSLRVSSSPPFATTGIDYEGPIHLTVCTTRGQKTTKHYVAVFVCFSTKTIHLECVNNYSIAGFLAAFDQFVNRRGLLANIYSDNATKGCVAGANRELQRNFRVVLRDSSLQDKHTTDLLALYPSGSRTLVAFGKPE